MQHLDLTRLRVNTDIELKLCNCEDTEIMFALVERNRQYLKQWVGWLDDNMDVEATREYVCNSICNFMHGTHYVFAIVYRGELVGTMGLTQLIGEVNLGYWLDKNHQRKGIITSCAHFLTRFALIELGVNRIVIRCPTQNIRSRAVAKRLKFTHERTARKAEWLYDHYVDLEIYAFLRSDLNDVKT